MTVPGSANTLLLRSSTTSSGYSISRSIRLSAPDSAYLSRTPASAGNRKTFTFACWIKGPFNAGDFPRILNVEGPSAGNRTTIRFTDTSKLEAYSYDGSNFQWQLQTTQVFRDPSAWFHLVVSVDTSQATSSNRAKIYINGTQVTAFGTASYPSLNFDTAVNHTSPHTICGGAYLSAYLADCFLIDSQALDPTAFGEFSATTGVWVPKAYTGSYGTNGFKLDFADNSSNTATTLGKDTSGNGNNWTPNNLSVSQVIGYQITGFDITNGGGAFANATLPASGNGANAYHFPRANGTYTLSRTLTASSKIEAYCYIDGTVTGTITANGGTAKTVPTGSAYAWQKVNLGVTNLSSISVAHSNWTSQDFWLSCFIVDDVVVYGTPALAAGNDSLVDVPTNGSEVDTGLGNQVRGNYCCWNPLDANSSLTISNGNLELTNTNSTARNVRGTIAFPTSGKWYYEITPGGSVQGAVGIGSSAVPLNVQNAASQVLYFEDGSKGVDASRTAYGASYTSGTVIGVAFDADLNQVTFYKNNVSQGAIGTTAGVQYFPFVMSFNATYVANFGQRPFAYPVAGYKSLNTASLPASVVTKPSTAMDVKLVTANNSTQTIAGFAFSPDLVWTQSRSQTISLSNHLYDTVRGVARPLKSFSTAAEALDFTSLTAFNPDGFTVNAGDPVNYGTGTGVAWCWDAGNTTVTNTQGSITSQVRANASAGFSVIGYTGTSANATVGHGLNVTPGLLICKSRTQSGGSNWVVWHSSFTGLEFLRLNTTDSKQSASVVFNSTAPTSSVISLGTDAAVNGSGNTHIIYAWSPVVGYSSMGSFVGNGSSDGVFQWCGFRPRFLLMKSATSATNWFVHDSARSGFNAARELLFPNLSNAEDASNTYVDFLSNGFKLRFTNTDYNTSGQMYIYYAVAESPFQYARAR